MDDRSALLPKFVRAMNHAQLTGMSVDQAMDFDDHISKDIGILASTPEGKKHIGAFKADSPPGVDPFTGATAKDYASLMLSPVKTLQSAGYNTVGAFGMAAAGFMKQLDEVADYLVAKTGMEKGGLFRRMHEVSLEKGVYYKGKAKEGGIGPITEFLTDVVGGVVPGIEQFVIDKLGVVQGTSMAEKARGKGENEFVAFMNGAMERLLMGQVFHVAAGLRRPYRAGVMGGLFEEQARHHGGETATPEELAKSFLTGAIFGTVGGPGKIGMKDVVREMRALEKEMGDVSFTPTAGPGESLIGGERGSIGDLPPAKGFVSPTAKVVESLGEKTAPAGEWEKRVTAWEGKYGGLKEENKWSGLHEWLKGQEGDLTKGEVLEFLEQSKQGWLEKVEQKDMWTPYNIPGGIPGTEKVFVFRVPLPADTGEDVPKFSSPHFLGIPDVVFHVRTHKMKDAEGNIGIVAETIQSDWHQQRGTESQSGILKELKAELDAGQITQAEYDRLSKKVEEGGGTAYVPPAPFEKTWHEAALKQVIDMAAQDPEVTWIGWPSGKVQMDRWGKDLDATDFRVEEADEGEWEVLDHRGNRVAGPFDNEDTANDVAVEYAQDNVGGDGNSFLEVLYDSKLPKFGKKYGEKLGGVYKKDSLGEPKVITVTAGQGNRPYTVQGDPDKTYPIHRIDLPPAAKEKVVREGQTFYSGIDITQLPRILKELGEDASKAFDSIKEVGRAVFHGGKNARGEWVEAMKAGIGPEWKKYADQLEEVWVYLEASQADQRKYRPALKVGDKVYEANPDENAHGQVWNRVPPEELLAAERGEVSLESGWVDKQGMWLGERPKVEPVPDPGLGADLTPSQVADLLTKAGVKADAGEWAARDPEISRLYEDTKKALAPTRLHNIKAIIRRATGQVKASELIEMREDKALSEQLRFAARQAKIAFREGERGGKAEGKVAGGNVGVRVGYFAGLKQGRTEASEHFHLALEKAKARKEASAEIRGWIADLKALDPSTMMDFARTEITTLLGDIDFTKLSGGKRLSLEKTREYLERSPDTELPDYVLDDLARLDKTPIRDMTMDQIESLHKAVMNLAAQSRLGQKLWDGIQERRYSEAMESSLAELRPPEKILGDIISTKPSWYDKALSIGEWVRNTLGLRQDSYDLIVETLAGVNSTPYRVLYRMVKRGDPTGVVPGGGIIGQKAYVQDTHAAFRADLEAAGFPFDKVGDVDKWLNERVKVEGDQGRTWELSRGERMALYRHSLNPDNLAAILEGGIGFKRPPASSGIKPNTVITLTEGDVAHIIKSLSPEELAFAGTPVDNLFQRQGQLLGDTFYTLNRYRMELEDTYYPKDVMPLTRGGYDLETEEGLEQFRQYTARVGIDKGMLIERTGSKRPIYLGDLMGDITRSVNRAAAYIHLEGPMRNASHLLYGPDTSFRKAIVDNYGREVWVEMEKGLKDIANNYRSWTETEQGLMRLKTNAVSSVISLNPWIWLNQPASLIFYNTYVDMKYLARGLADVATPSGAKTTLDLALRNSPELVERLMTGYDRDVAAAYQGAREREYYGGGHTMREKMILPTKWADMTAVLPGMRASYLKAMDELQGKVPSKPVRDALDIQDPNVIDSWTPEQMEAKAWEFADWVTERTQAQAGAEHRPPLSRGSSVEQMFTALTSQVNTMLNLARRTKREYERTGLPEDRGAMMKAYFQIFVLNAAFMLGIDRVRDMVYGRESKSLTQGFIDNAAGMVIFLRDVESTISSHLFEGERGFDSRIPIQKPLETLGKMSTTLNTMVTSKDQRAIAEAQGKFLDLTLDLVATLNGVPYHTPKRILDAAAGNNPPPKRRNAPDFVDELIE